MSRRWPRASSGRRWAGLICSITVTGNTNPSTAGPASSNWPARMSLTTSARLITSQPCQASHAASPVTTMVGRYSPLAVLMALAAGERRRPGSAIMLTSAPPARYPMTRPSACPGSGWRLAASGCGANALAERPVPPDGKASDQAARHDTRAGRDRQRDHGGPAAFPEVMYRPVVLACRRPERTVWIDHVRMTDQVEQRQVVRRIAVRTAARQVQPFALGQGLHGGCLRLTVQQAADQPACVDTVLGLGDGAKRAGEAEPAGQDARQLDWGGGHQPHTLARVKMSLGQLPGAFPDPVGHRVVIDLLAEREDISDLVPCHKRQRGLPRGVDVI